jgi:hypothetical protein
VEQSRVLNDQRVGFGDRLAHPDLGVVDAAERDDRCPRALRAEARERLGMAILDEGGYRDHLGGREHTPRDPEEEGVAPVAVQRVTVPNAARIRLNSVKTLARATLPYERLAPLRAGAARSGRRRSASALVSPRSDGAGTAASMDAGALSIKQSVPAHGRRGIGERPRSPADFY